MNEGRKIHWQEYLPAKESPRVSPWAWEEIPVPGRFLAWGTESQDREVFPVAIIEKPDGTIAVCAAARCRFASPLEGV